MLRLDLDLSGVLRIRAEDADSFLHLDLQDSKETKFVVAEEDHKNKMIGVLGAESCTLDELTEHVDIRRECVKGGGCAYYFADEKTLIIGGEVSRPETYVIDRIKRIMEATLHCSFHETNGSGSTKEAAYVERIGSIELLPPGKNPLKCKLNDASEAFTGM